MASSASRDHYAARLGVATVVAAIVIAIAALFGPTGDPDAEWYEHTGFEGELLLLDAIDVVQDRDLVSQTEAQSLPGATQGVEAPITERVRHASPLDPVPLERPRGDAESEFQRMQRADPRLTAEIVDRDQVKMSRPAQQSSDFVLLKSLSPRYPSDVAPALRERRIVVRVNMYVDESGHVAHAYVDRNEGGPRFESAVLEAVRQWVYRPLVRDGKPTGFWDTIYFIFQIEGSATAHEFDFDPGG